MIISLLVIAMLAVGITAVKDQKKEEFKKLNKKKHPFVFFYPLAQKITDIWISMEISDFVGKRNGKNAKRQKAGMENLETVSRISIVLFVMSVTSVLSIFTSLLDHEVDKISNNVVKLPDYVENSAQIDVNVYKEGQEIPYEIEISLPARKYTRAEADQNFERAREYLLSNILKENESLDKVTGDLDLISRVDKYAISVDWKSSDYSVVDYDGSVHNEDFENTGTLSSCIELTALMKYEEYECEFPVYIVVFPARMTDSELFIKNIQAAVKSALEENIYKEEVSLPTQIDGVKVEYKVKKTGSSFVIALLGLMAGCALLYGTEAQKKKEIENREKQMKYDYSEVVAKLTLLLGAGMTISRAWEKIATDYKAQTESGVTKTHYAYDEMLITYFQMKSGMQETKAYAEFGKRCGIREYLKLGALLEQNIKKGTRGLAEMLENEAADAFEERKNIARKLGEEAGTKLLVPMVIMLVIVMIIVTIPAFMSFGI